MSDEKITQNDHDNLADIAWWIKGYRAAADAGDSSCPFYEDHINSLEKVLIRLKKELSIK